MNTIAPNSLLAKFAPALLPLLVAVLLPLQVYMLDGVFAPEEIWLYVGAIGAALLTWALPLVPGSWAGIFKVGINLVVALSALVVPLIPGNDWSFSVLIGLALGLVQALAAQIGVDVRLDAQKPVIDSREDPNVPTITSLDPKALAVVAPGYRH